MSNKDLTELEVMTMLEEDNGVELLFSSILETMDLSQTKRVLKGLGEDIVLNDFEEKAIQKSEKPEEKLKEKAQTQIYKKLKKYGGN